MRRLKSFLLLFKDALGEYFKDRAGIYAAGLAYYTLFSLAPLLVFLTSIAGLFIGRSAAGDQVALQLQYLVGPELAGTIEGMVDTLTDRTIGATATVVSAVALLIGAGGIFNQLRNALNLLWGITDLRPTNLHEWLIVIRHRVIPFLMVFVFGLLLSIAFIVETLMNAVRARLEVLFPDLVAFLPGFSALLVPLLALVTFYLIFRVLPDARTRSRDAAVGALVTTVLFLIGRRLLAFFLSFSDTGSLYGAAGSIVIFLVWVYFSAQILLYGAEFTWLYARRHGQPIRPSRMATFLVSDELRPTSNER